MRRYPHAWSGVLLLLLTVVLAASEAMRGFPPAFPWHVLNFVVLAVLVGTMPPPDERGRTVVRGWRKVGLAVCFVVAILWLWKVERI